MSSSSGPSDDEASPEGPQGHERLGSVLDRRYRLDAVLGVGGLGTVYRAEHVGLGRGVAVKVLHPQFGEYEEFRRRFEREARVLSSLEHEHIVMVTDYGTEDGVPYLAMELLEGTTLADHLRQQAPPEPQQAVDLAIQVAEALAFAHGKGVLHRDLKPENIFLIPREQGGHHVKILDFGLAKLTAETDKPSHATLTADGTILGTPSYTSPEQAAGSQSDARSDVYSLGVVLYEMLCGRPPFVSDNWMQILRAHLSVEVPAPTDMRPGLWLSAELDEVLACALRKHRDERYADAGELLEALRALPSPAATVSPEAAAHAAPSSSASGGLADQPTLPAGTTASSGAATAPGARDDSVPSSAERPPGARESSTAALTTALRRPGLLAAAGAASVAIVGLVAMTLFWDADTDAAPSTEGTEAGAAASADRPGDEPSGSTAEDGPPAARDPFAKLPKPPLRYVYRAVKGGHQLDRPWIKKLQEYQRKHRDDPRPSLLLAHDFSKRDWLSDALERYRLVHEIDPSARGSPWMKRDLLRMAGTRSHGAEAARLIERIYGSEIVVEIDRMLEQHDLDRAAARRLRKLRDRLG